MNYGELQAYNYLQANGWDVEDVTQDKYYWDKDIDLIALNGLQRLTIEVKWDSRISQTGNMFIETITDLDKNRSGWFMFCEADLIFYGDSVNHLFYVFTTKNLREFVSSRIMQERKAADYTLKGTIKKVSQGMLVPIKEFSQNYDVKVILLDRINQYYQPKKRGYTAKKTTKDFNF